MSIYHINQSKVQENRPMRSIIFPPLAAGRSRQQSRSTDHANAMNTNADEKRALNASPLNRSGGLAARSSIPLGAVNHTGS